MGKGDIRIKRMSNDKSQKLNQKAINSNHENVWIYFICWSDSLVYIYSQKTKELQEMAKGRVQKKNTRIWDICQIRADPTHPWGNWDIKNWDKIQKYLPPPPLEEIVTFFNKCLKVWLQESVQFEGTRSLILVNLTKNRAKTNIYHEKAMKIGWKVDKLWGKHFDMQSFHPPPCHNFL